MTSRKISSDLFLATSFHLLQKLFGFAVIVVLARHLDKSSMGELFFAIAFSTMFGLLTELGTSTHINRSAAHDAGNALRELSAIVSLRVVLIALSLLLISGFVLGLRPEMGSAFILISFAVFLEHLYFSFGAFFVGARRVGYRFLTGLTGPLLLMILVTLAVAGEVTVTEIAICYVGANATMVCVTFAVVRLKIGPVRWVWATGKFTRILKASMPFFILAFLALVHFKVDTLMLFLMDSAVAVALYEAAYKILEVSRFVVRPVAMVFFPLCAAMVARNQFGELRILAKKLILVAAAAGVIASVVMFSAAEWIVPAVFGDGYVDSVWVVRVLFLSAPALFVGFVGGFLATSLHLEKTAVKLTFGCVLVNVVLNGFAIPRWGAIGAAWTTVITEWVLAICLLYIILRQLWPWLERDRAAQSTRSNGSLPRAVTESDQAQEVVDCDA